MIVIDKKLEIFIQSSMALFGKRIILTSFETVIRVDHLFHRLKHNLKRLNADPFLSDSIAKQGHSFGVKLFNFHIVLSNYFSQQD